MTDSVKKVDLKDNKSEDAKGEEGILCHHQFCYRLARVGTTQEYREEG